MPLHAQGQGLQALEKQPGVEGAHGRPHVPQSQHAGTQDEGEAAERLVEFEPVIRRIGFQEIGKTSRTAQSNVPESTMMPPMEVPCPPMNLVAEWTTMAAPWAMGLSRKGVGNGVVHHQGNPVAVAHCSNLFDIDDIQFGVADALDEEGFCFIRNRRLPGVHVRWGLQNAR